MEIAGYEDLEEIGRGGFAVVYRGHQAAFGRSVAIKVLTSPGLTDLDRSRFEREALAMGQLSWHPNIVVVHATGQTEAGLPYLVMEYLEGGSLGERLRTSGALPPAEAVDHLVRLSAAAHTAHEANLLHRDVKPDNALIDTFGRVKLADFGIAAVTGSTLTATGMVTATVAHAAPEVLNGQRATFAADVYSLGSTLYELLAGVSAFARETDESIVPLVLRATGEPVPDLRLRGIPDPIASVVEEAMAKDPADRQSSALELGRALQRAQQAIGVPVTDLAVRAGSLPDPANETVSTPPAPLPPVAPKVENVTTQEPAVVEMAAPTGTVAVPPVAPPPAPGQPARAPGPPAKRRSRLPVVLLVVVALALGGVLYVVATGGDDDPGRANSESFGDAPPGDDGGDTTPVVIDVGDRPFRLAATGDAVWATNSEATDVTRVDPATDAAVATVDVGGEPAGVGQTEGAVWVAVYDTDVVQRIDPATNQVTQTIAVGNGPRNVAATDAAIWVPNLNDNTVSRIDPATNLVAINIPVGAGPRGITATDTDVWVTNYEGGSVSRIDPSSNQVVATIDVGGTPGGVVVSGGSVWVTESESDVLIRIDPSTDEVADRIEVGADPGGLAATEDAVFVANSAVDTVSRIDARTGEITDVIDVGDAPGGLAVTATDLWVANTEDDTVSRVPLG